MDGGTLACGRRPTKVKAAPGGAHAAGLRVHSAGLAVGGACPDYIQNHDAAFPIDPDGNNVEAACEKAG